MGTKAARLNRAFKKQALYYLCVNRLDQSDKKMAENHTYCTMNKMKTVLFFSMVEVILNLKYEL